MFLRPVFDCLEFCACVVHTVTKKMKRCKKELYSKRPTRFCKLAKRKMSGKAKCCKWVTIRERPDDQDVDDDDNPELPECDDETSDDDSDSSGNSGGKGKGEGKGRGSENDSSESD